MPAVQFPLLTSLADHAGQHPTDLGVIKVTGSDARAFIHGQVTCNIATLDEGHWRFGGHCDAKGKLWSIFRVCWWQQELLLVQPRSSISASLTQLQKFAVFSKVELADVSDTYSVQLDLNSPRPKGELITSQTDCTLGLGDASLIVSNSAITDNIIDNHSTQLWQAYEIEHGVPVLQGDTQQQFVPQMVNLDTLAGIDFKKGCYIGQETVARMHYLGQNKRRLRLLTGSAEQLPSAGTTLEQAMGESWRRAGAVISSVRYDNDIVALLAVLPADIEDNAAVRIKDVSESTFSLRPPFDNQEISHE